MEQPDLTKIRETIHLGFASIDRDEDVGRAIRELDFLLDEVRASRSAIAAVNDGLTLIVSRLSR